MTFSMPMNDDWVIEVRKVKSDWEYRVVYRDTGHTVAYNEVSYDNKLVKEWTLKISSPHHPISIFRPTADGYALTRKGAIRKAKRHISYVMELQERIKAGSPEWEIT